MCPKFLSESSHLDGISKRKSPVVWLRAPPNGITGPRLSNPITRAVPLRLPEEALRLEEINLPSDLAGALCGTTISVSASKRANAFSSLDLDAHGSDHSRRAAFPFCSQTCVTPDRKIEKFVRAHLTFQSGPGGFWLLGCTGACWSQIVHRVYLVYQVAPSSIALTKHTNAFPSFFLLGDTFDRHLCF